MAVIAVRFNKKDTEKSDAMIENSMPEKNTDERRHKLSKTRKRYPENLYEELRQYWS